MTFTRRKFNRKFRGGKKKTIRKKRKTRRKRRGGRKFKASDMKSSVCNPGGKQLSYFDCAKKVEELPEEELTQVNVPVKSTLGCVDDDSAKYGSKGNNNCERLRGKV